MNWRLSGAAVIVTLAFFTLNAQRSSAQNSIAMAGAARIAAAPTPALVSERLPKGHSFIVVRVIGESGRPLKEQAVVQLWSDGEAPVYAVTQEGAAAKFDVLQSRRYTVRASVAGYEAAERSLQTFTNDTYYQTILKPRQQPTGVTEANAANSGAAAHAWRPPAVGEEEVRMADGIVCPTATVLDGAMRSVDELVDNVNRFAATESVSHENLDEAGKATSEEHRKFDYVVSIKRVSSGDLDVDESRNGAENYAGFPQGIATLGLPSLAFLFHERYRGDYELSCDGLSEWQARATWVIEFRQRPDRTSRIRSYDIGGQMYPVSLKGRAWITADSFQVVRMEADAMEPVPAIKLRGEYQAIEYKPVHFQTTNTDLWLPASAELYFDFRNHKYHRVHSFSSYLLFSVSASEKIGMPKELAAK